MKSIAHCPIGIFDSGIGGLTVAHAVAEKLPYEDIVYFGDTAHLPYGDKSTAAIQAYAIKICDVLLKHQCKLILIACNSASAAAYDLVKEYVGKKAHVVNVIDPVVDYLVANYADKKIGLIGTNQTVYSGIYKKKLDERHSVIELHALATPLLAPMIEKGFFNNKISEQVIHEYLSDPVLQNIDVLVLGCTHYPLIKDQIARFYNKNIDMVDATELVARVVDAYLDGHQLYNNGVGNKKFFVSDLTRSFQEATRLFFMEEVKLEYYPLWE